MSEILTLTLTLVVAPRKCKKCVEARELLERMQEQFGERVTWREVGVDTPEAAEFGVALTPMLLVGDFIAAAGRVPDEQALARLIAQRLERAS